MFHKVEIGSLISKFTNARYTNVGGVINYILRIIQMAMRLKELNVPVADDFPVHHVLNSLLMKFCS